MFGHRMRTHRLRLGLSQDDLAQRAGVDVKTVGNIEAGRTRPRPSTVRLLVDALQLDGDDRADLYARASADTGVLDQPAQSLSDPAQPAVAAVPAQLPANVAGSPAAVSSWPSSMICSPRPTAMARTRPVCRGTDTRRRVMTRCGRCR